MGSEQNWEPLEGLEQRRDSLRLSLNGSLRLLCGEGCEGAMQGNQTRLLKKPRLNTRIQARRQEGGDEKGPESRYILKG